MLGRAAASCRRPRRTATPVAARPRIRVPQVDEDGDRAARPPARSGDQPRDLVDDIGEGLRAALPELDDPGLVLTQRAVRLAQLLERMLTSEMADHGLSQTDYAVLTVLLAAGRPHELRPTDLRERLLITSGGLSNVINRLVRSGLLERVPDRVDGRSSWVRLTGRGVDQARQVARAWARAQQRFYRDVDRALVTRSADDLRAVLVDLGDGPVGTSSRPAAED
jgi:DNA-binding MarR family transcriptional regulator